MRLLIPIIIIVLGMLSGAIISRLIRHNENSFKLGMLAGVAGAFGGIVIRDLFDINMDGGIGTTLLAALMGAVLLAAIVTLAGIWIRR